MEFPSHNEQVQVVDQTTHPPKCHSFVGLDRQIGSSPPRKTDRSPMTPRVSHTHKANVRKPNANPGDRLSIALHGHIPMAHHPWQHCTSSHRFGSELATECHFCQVTQMVS